MRSFGVFINKTCKHHTTLLSLVHLCFPWPWHVWSNAVSVFPGHDSCDARVNKAPSHRTYGIIYPPLSIRWLLWPGAVPVVGSCNRVGAGCSSGFGGCSNPGIMDAINSSGIWGCTWWTWLKWKGLPGWCWGKKVVWVEWYMVMVEAEVWGAPLIPIFP